MQGLESGGPSFDQEQDNYGRGQYNLPPNKGYDNSKGIVQQPDPINIMGVELPLNVVTYMLAGVGLAAILAVVLVLKFKK